VHSSTVSPLPRTIARRFAGTIALLSIVFSGASDRGRLAAAPPPAVDLATYIRVGRFDLPEPTRTTPPAGSLLAQEASAVTYNWDTDTLFVVGDGGTSVVQVRKNGTLIDSMTLAPGASPQGTEFYDTEGVSYLGGGQFVLIEERDRQVSLFTYVAGGTLHRSDVKTVKLGTTIGNIGFEGISADPQTGGFIIVKEKDPESIFQTGIDFVAGTATNGSPSATSSTNLFDPALAGLADFSDVFALSNLPYLAGQPDSSHLLIISQESGQIINVSRSGVVSSRLTIVADPGSPLSVPDMTMEGITMDRDGNLYVVNENGGGDSNHPQLWVYAHSDAPNLAPVQLTLQNAVTSIAENTSTANPVKLADIVVTDDGLGTNNLSVSGPDAGTFQVIGTGLYLKAGTPLSSTTKPLYSIAVNVDDPGVGGPVDATTNYTLTITPATSGTATLLITEVAPWSSGNSTLGADWFEVTNVGTAAQNIAGWKMDDDSNAFGNAVALNDITSIAPGESVIFIESATSRKADFLKLWFGAKPPANLQVGFYSGSGVGLSTGGDAVNLFDAGGTKRAGVTFGVATTTSPLKTFDNAAGLNNAPVTALSATGINGAFAITDGTSTAIGSPGTIGAPATPVVAITATDPNASETGSDPGTFRITRTGSIAGSLIVNYTISGTASPADYTPALGTTATIAPGQSFVDIPVTPIDDGLFEGAETVTLTVFDTGSYDAGTPTTATVTIADNDPPNTSIDNSPASATSSTTAQFTFSGSQPASAIARFECSLDSSAFSTCTSPASYPNLANGSHTFQVRAVATFGPVDPTPASFTWIVDTIKPVITVGASDTVLSPPNGKLVPDTISGTIVDALSGVDAKTASFRVVDEYGEVQPSGAVQLDSQGRFSFVVMLDSSRLGSDRDGRTYEIQVSARDLAGNPVTASVIVTVAHDQRK
jgi:uncharacterized protein YjiK